MKHSLLCFTTQRHDEFWLVEIGYFHLDIFGNSKDIYRVC